MGKCIGKQEGRKSTEEVYEEVYNGKRKVYSEIFPETLKKEGREYWENMY